MTTKHEKRHLIGGYVFSSKGEQDMSEDKKEIVFNQEKSGNTEKYESTGGVRGPTATVEKQEDTKAEEPIEVLREQMREQLAQKLTTTTTVDFGSALSSPDKKAIAYGVVGAGHGGSRLAEQFHQFGYRVCVLNTAKQDLEYIQLPDDQKLFLDFALGGVGKDLDLGETAAVENEEKIKQFLDRHFGQDGENVDQIILCIGGGGGTGSGSSVPLIQSLSEYNIPITVLYTLPMSNEGTVTKWNAIVTLDKLSKLAMNNLISGLIVIDNARIEEVYAGVSLGGFFKVANYDIANIFNSFNTMSSLPTEYQAIDPMDFARIMSSGNCIIYGKLEIPLFAEDGLIEVGEDDIASALLHNVQNSLLAEGFDITEAMRAGIYITGKKQYLDQIPASAFNYAFASLNNLLSSADTFKGVYNDERLEDTLVVYTLIGGLGLPRERVELLKEQAQEDLDEMEAKEGNQQQKMAVFTQLSSRESDTYRQQKKRNSTFGRIAQRKKRSRN